jgi:hypothetical protein
LGNFDLKHILHECEKGGEGVDYGMRFRRIHGVIGKGGRVYRSEYHDRSWVVYI